MTRIKILRDYEYRNAYLGIEKGATEGYKRIMSERAVEDLDKRYATLDEVSREFDRRSYELRFQMDALKAISYNLRAELGM